jgi:hypothetical protein
VIAVLTFFANQVTSIEFALVEKDVIFGLKQGNQVLKDIQKEMNLENVEKLMAETADGIAYQRVGRLFRWMHGPGKRRADPAAITGNQRNAFKKYHRGRRRSCPG